MKKPIVLVLLGHFFPGYKSGGPTQSIEGLVHNLGSEFDFRVVTTDRDYGDKLPYQNIVPNEWTKHGDASIYYIPLGPNFPFSIMQLLRKTPHDILYINSLCSRFYSIFPLWAWHLGFVPHAPVIIAPRGELSEAALRHNRPIKKAYILALKIAGIHRRVVWQASSPSEKGDIKKHFYQDAMVSVVQDLKVPIMIVGALKNATDNPISYSDKSPGKLSIVYLARIHPHKNLLLALKILEKIRGQVTYDLYGLMEDAKYWSECGKAILRLPPDVIVSYKGVIAHEEVQYCLSNYHALFLPTKSENYGHSIVEALLAGLPVVISDQTPWRRLPESNAGWDISLNEQGRFIETIQQLIDMDDEEFKLMRTGARLYALQRCATDEVKEQNRGLLNAMLSNRIR